MVDAGQEESKTLKVPERTPFAADGCEQDAGVSWSTVRSGKRGERQSEG